MPSVASFFECRISSVPRRAGGNHIHGELVHEYIEVRTYIRPWVPTTSQSFFRDDCFLLCKRSLHSTSTRPARHLRTRTHLPGPCARATIFLAFSANHAAQLDATFRINISDLRSRHAQAVDPTLLQLLLSAPLPVTTTDLLPFLRFSSCHSGPRASAPYWRGGLRIEQKRHRFRLFEQGQTHARRKKDCQDTKGRPP